MAFVSGLSAALARASAFASVFLAAFLRGGMMTQIRRSPLAGVGEEEEQNRGAQPILGSDQGRCRWLTWFA